MPSTSPPSRPPQDYFSVWQRLFRGYGPLAMFAALVVVIALLVPSRVQKVSTTGNNAGGNGSSVALGTDSTGGSGAAGSAAGGTAGAAGGSATTAGAAGGAAGTGGTAGKTSTSGGVTSGGHTGAIPGAGVPTGAKVAGCGAQQFQLPGDPYSPPCVTFSGSNGGATTKGVDANTIHVAYRVTSDKGFQQTLAQLAGASLQDTQADIQRTITTLATFFNTHYQFYGRKMQIDFYNGQGALTNELLGQGQAQADADAVTVGQQKKDFADLSAESEPYADALSKQGVMAFGDPYMSQNWHVAHAPFAWSVAVDGTTVANLGANYAVKKLCPQGSPAAYAGGSDAKGPMKGAPRKFATLAPENSWYQESVQSASNIVAGAGCGTPENIVYQLDLGTMSSQASSIITKLKSDNVTTVVCGCDPIIPVFLSGEAARQGYFPEFVIVGTALTDQDIVGQLWNQQFAAHAFGISPNAQAVPATQTLGYAAYKTVRQDEPAFGVELIYQQMAELAIGIQMAGPNLTPQTFQQGMFNYPKRQGPNGLWGFGPRDYTTTDDVREICWSPTTVSTYNQKPGAYNGTSNQRWTAATIPGGPPGCPIPS